LPIDSVAILEFFDDSLGKILAITGVVFFSIGILFFGSSDYQWISAVSLFSGTLCFVTGIALHIEGSLELKFPSRSGLGTILMCSSALLLAGSAIFVFVIKTPIEYRIPQRFLIEMPVMEALASGGIPHEALLRIREIAVRPLAWLAPFLLILGICMLLTGFLLKFRYSS